MYNSIEIMNVFKAYPLSGVLYISIYSIMYFDLSRNMLQRRGGEASFPLEAGQTFTSVVSYTHSIPPTSTIAVISI
jgi:hypothetical protein